MFVLSLVGSFLFLYVFVFNLRDSMIASVTYSMHTVPPGAGTRQTPF